MTAQKTYKIVLYNNTYDEPAKEINYPIKDGFDFSTEHRYLDEAVAVIFHMPTLKESDLKVMTKMKKKGQYWVFWSQECEIHFEWQHSPQVLALFDIIATYKLDSTIPQPYFQYGHLKLLRTPPSLKTGFVNAFISNGIFERSNRTSYMTKLMSYISIDSYGKAFNNRQIVDDKGVESKMEIISRYKFSIAFENAIAKDYVSEKFFQPLERGSVPIYLGAPNIEEFAPGEKCYINVESFASPRKLADYLIELDNDDAKYEEYLNWKKMPFRPEFEARLKGRTNALHDLVNYIKEHMPSAHQSQ